MLVAQLLGLYFLIVGVIVLYRKQSIMPGMNQLIANRTLVIVLALVELLAGLAVVLTYPSLSWDWMGLISLIGWMMIVESVIYLAMPYGRVAKLLRTFSRGNWLQAGGVIGVIAGGYLAAIGFGIL